jgi:hypothetical protein
MADTELRADSAPSNPTPDLNAFGPGEFLARFKKVGGWWIVAEGKHHLGWAIAGYTHEQNLEARRIFGEIEKDEGKREAVRAFMLAQTTGA